METLQKQVFLSGICDLYRMGDSGLPDRLYDGIPLDERTVGFRRSFDAMQAGHTVNKVIRIPVVPTDLNGCYVKLTGGEESTFQILLAQKIFDTCPQCLQLTLEQVNICWALEQEGE